MLSPVILRLHPRHPRRRINPSSFSVERNTWRPVRTRLPTPHSSSSFKARTCARRVHPVHASHTRPFLDSTSRHDWTRAPSSLGVGTEKSTSAIRDRRHRRRATAYRLVCLLPHPRRRFLSSWSPGSRLHKVRGMGRAHRNPRAKRLLDDPISLGRDAERYDVLPCPLYRSAYAAPRYSESALDSPECATVLRTALEGGFCMPRPADVVAYRSESGVPTAARLHHFARPSRLPSLTRGVSGRRRHMVNA